MLGNEYRMPPHRGLLAVVPGKCRSKPFGNKILRMVPDHLQPLLFNICPVLMGQVKPGTEGRSFQPFQCRPQLMHFPLSSRKKHRTVPNALYGV